MIKKEIIKLVANMKSEIGENKIKEILSFDKLNNDKKIGTNQFRELANLCDNNDIQCYDEIELLIKYNTAKNYEKAKDKKIGQSWAFVCANDKKFGDIVIEKMEKIRNENNQNDVNTLKDLSLFFGYLFWQSKVWIMEVPKKEDEQISKDSKKTQKSNQKRN